MEKNVRVHPESTTKNRPGMYWGGVMVDVDVDADE